MKKILKGEEPLKLASYRRAVPTGTWEQMKNDAFFGGRDAYKECRERLIDDQGGICAYCEIDLSISGHQRFQIEHFHPKSDKLSIKNWALDWYNLLGVCAGGSYVHDESPYALKPLQDSLSCDQYKNSLIGKGSLDECCEGFILDPRIVVASPVVFRIEHFTGIISPCPEGCRALEGNVSNRYATAEELVQKTIDALNLNCARLCEARRIVARDINRNKKLQRDKGFDGDQVRNNLAERYLSRRKWPRFFTTIRFCLGSAAEEYLEKIKYEG